MSSTSKSRGSVERSIRKVLGLPLIVVLAGAGGDALARRALTPIDRLAADARRITAERLHERLAVANEHDEIGRLAGVINNTFPRLESSFDQLRRFTADASHELRTPLSIIRGIGELQLGDTRTAAEYKDAIGFHARRGGPAYAAGPWPGRASTAFVESPLPRLSLLGPRRRLSPSQTRQ
jgi:signal transduction histidine kinase